MVAQLGKLADRLLDDSPLQAATASAAGDCPH